ncbi:MAG: hypothetical protein AB9842_02295 [Bacteroidales bacterium]
MNNLLKINLFLLLFSGFSFSAYTQNSLLDVKITVNITEKPVEKLLEEIEKQHSLRFSYNSNIIPRKQLSISAKNKSVGKVLGSVFGKGYYFKSTGRYIIILKKKEESHDSVKQAGLILTGNVIDFRTGKHVKEATIYDMSSMASILTDSAGNFILSFNPRTTSVGLRCCKSGYRDTVIMVNPGTSGNIAFRLLSNMEPFLKPATLPAGKLASLDTFPVRLASRLVPKEMKINSLNVEDYDIRPAQLSLLPWIGTNLRMSGSVANHFSINLLGGYSAGVKGFEAGGLVNITRHNVTGLQLCCVANLGADTVRGAQMAGLINICESSVRGLQLSPGINISKGEVQGAQLAGLFNYSPKPAFQLGLVNMADTASGAPLGVINIIKGGYYYLSFFSDELANFGISFLMGTPKLYSIAGFSGYKEVLPDAWGISYGFGSHLWSKHRLSCNLEFLSSVIASSGKLDSLTISRASLSAQLSWRISRNIYLSAGPTVNTLISAADNPNAVAFMEKTDRHLFMDYSPRNTRFDGWVGGMVAFRCKF